MTNSKLPWTHFHIAADGRISGFTLDQCETCEGLVQAANAVTLRERPERLERLGLIRMDRLPSEGYHDEDSGMEVCDNCG